MEKNSRALHVESNEPQSYREAMAMNKEKWLPAYQKEFDAQIRNKTWILVPLPVDRTALNCKMIGKIKPAYEGVEETYKGRLVVIGTGQRYGMDYEETFAPVPHSESVKVVLSECAAQNMEVMQFDISTAFLYADLDKEVYMKQPEGFIAPGKENLVCLLKKSVNGLKQAPRLWHGRFDRTLLRLGFKPCRADPCVYIKRTNTETSYIIVHVDDAWTGSKRKQTLIEVQEAIGEEYQFKVVPPTRYIGINITMDPTNSRYFLSQQHLIEKILTRFGMNEAFPRVTPADPKVKLSVCKGQQSEGERGYSFREAVGALLYIALQTRPDLAYAVCRIAKFCQNPMNEHWKALDQIFGYLKATKEYGIWVGGQKKGLACYVDADFAGDIDDSKSTSGSIMFLNDGPVAWSSKKQPTTALSTTEAEYIAVCQGGKTAVWLGYLLEDLLGKDIRNIPMYCDNEGAVRLVHNPELHQRTKHIRLKWHWIREQVADGLLAVKFVRTHNQLADTFTKALPGPRFVDMRKRIGVGVVTDLPSMRLRETVADQSHTSRQKFSYGSHPFRKRLYKRPRGVSV
jgi:hypothetical protein